MKKRKIRDGDYDPAEHRDTMQAYLAYLGVDDPPVSICPYCGSRNKDQHEWPCPFAFEKDDRSG